MLKKILSCVLLAILTLTCLTGCGEDDGVPDGMYSATIESDPFILYVPEGWTDNRDSGISSAYYSLSDAVMASARYYTPDMSGEFSLSDYVYDFIVEFESANPSFVKLAEEDSALGENKALRCKYSFDRTVDSSEGALTANVTVTQYYAIHGSDVVVLSLFCDTSKYGDEYIEMFEQIRSEFVFCDKKAVNDAVTDKKTPEGMKRASFDNSEYAFYVPTSWYCDMSHKLTEAYFPESGKPNVTVTSFSPDSATTTPAQYFAMCEEAYKKDIPGYEKIGEESRTVGGCSAVSYTYKAVYGSTQTEYTKRLNRFMCDLVLSAVLQVRLKRQFCVTIAETEVIINIADKSSTPPFALNIPHYYLIFS